MVAQLRLVYNCDHIVSAKDMATTTITMRRGYRADGSYVGGNIDAIESVPSVYFIDKITYTPPSGLGTVTISPELYNLYSGRIVWLRPTTNATSGIYRIPNEGDNYTVTARYYTMTVTKHDLKDCPKCHGTGWYMSPLAATGIEAASGVLLVAQEFIKCLLTIPGTDYLADNYGGGLLTDGRMAYLDSNLTSHISDAVRSAEAQCIANTSLEVRDYDEILDRVVINSIDLDHSMPGASVVLTLYTLRGSQISFSINV